MMQTLFFLDLHSKLKLETPEIINKPFTFLKGIVDGIKDIEEYKQQNEHQEKYQNIKERFEITKGWIQKAVNEIEDEDSLEKFKQDIIDATIKAEFVEHEKSFLTKIKLPKYQDAKFELSYFFNHWGDVIFDAAKINDDQKLYNESIKKYKKSLEFDKNASIYNNIALAIKNLAYLNKDEKLYNKSFEAYKAAIDIDENHYQAYNNYGTALADLAEQKNDKLLFEKSFEKYQLATSIDFKNHSAYYNWANALSRYALLVPEEEKRNIYLLANEKANVAFSLNEKKTYNLACSYALLNDKEMALKFLEESFKGNEITKAFVSEDEDWGFYKEDKDFNELLSKY